MTAKKANRITILAVTITILLFACAAPGTQVNNTAKNTTGIAELDKIIDIALRGDTAGLKSLIKLTQTNCTLADGLGSPPKCLEGEQEGSMVEVLPFLGSEGYFLRKSELENWQGVEVSALFAVYEAATPIFVDKNYPPGKYAIIFIGKDTNTGITLRVDQGKIVRIDYGFENPPTIREDEVVRFLVQPIEVNP